MAWKRHRSTSRKNIIHLLLHSLVTGGPHISHRGLKIGVPHPFLYRPDIDSSPETARSECRAEFVQPKVLLVEVRAFSAGLQTIQKILLRLHPEVGNTSGQFLSAFAFQAFRFFTSFAGIGISRSLYAFGVQPRYQDRGRRTHISRSHLGRS